MRIILVNLEWCGRLRKWLMNKSTGRKGFIYDFFNCANFASFMERPSKKEVGEHVIVHYTPDEWKRVKSTVFKLLGRKSY